MSEPGEAVAKASDTWPAGTPIDGRPRCAARTRKGGRCRRSPGQGTLHKGRGRCSLHGGVSDASDGRLTAAGTSSMYGVQIPRLGELFDQAEALENKSDTSPEVSMLRALLALLLERTPTAKELDLDLIGRHIDRISKAVKRIEDVRSAEHISRAEFYRVLMELGRVVDVIAGELIADRELREELLTRIRKGWLSIRLA